MSIFCASRRASTPYGVSQNFLTAVRTIERLLDRTDIGPDDLVWEIGPGKGHITRRLMLRCDRVVAVEIDPALHEKLPARLGHPENVRLLCGDFLQARLPERGAYKVFANPPYNAISAIVRKLTTAANPPKDCWLVMEKGAAKRFCGLPAETLHSLMLKPYFEPRIVFHLRREEFHPMPACESVLVHFHRRSTPDLSPGQRPALEAFLRQTRGSSKGLLSNRQAQAALRQAGLADIPASGTLSYVQWLCLFRCWARR